MPSFPYFTERTHDTGVVSNASGNAARDTALSNSEGSLVIDMAERVFLLDIKVSPLTGLLTNAGKSWDGKSLKGQALLTRTVANPEFDELESNVPGRFCKVSGAGYAASGAVTITVTGSGSSPAYIFTPGDVVVNMASGERLLVATVASTATITVAAAGRAYGTTAAASGNAQDSLLIIGNVNEENGGVRNVNSTRLEKVTNYTQIFRNTMSVSGTESEAELYGGPDLPHQRKVKGIEHARDIERSFLWGEKKKDTGGTQGKPRRATGGIEEHIVSQGAYVQNQNGPLTAPDMEIFIREGFTYGSATKLLMAGGRVLSALSEIARGQIETKNGDSTYGLSIQEWVSPHGTVNVVHNPLMVDEFSGWAFLLDLESFRYAKYRNRDTKLRMNVQAPDIDGQVDEFLTECGLERRGAARNALLKGVV